MALVNKQGYRLEDNGHAFLSFKEKKLRRLNMTQKKKWMHLEVAESLPWPFSEEARSGSHDYLLSPSLSLSLCVSGWRISMMYGCIL